VIRIEPLDATFGAVVTGVRLDDLDSASFSQIERTFHEFAVLVFPAQHLAEAQQIAFAQRFGEIEQVREAEDITSLTNTTPDGGVVGADHPVMSIMRGNSGWHTDSSYMPVSARASVLSAHVVPSGAGGTEWADMRAAYDALDDATRSIVDRASALHSIKYSQARAGETRWAGYGFQVETPPRRPLVKIHPVTGRRALFIGRHAYDVDGLTAAESEALLDRLVDEACRPPRVYTHRWSVGDCVIWDNRCVLHRAEPWAWDEPRVMKHTRIAGDPVTESALA
jgi:alpha-ketoglutarate-dependent taurine dioxygenase